MSMTCYRTRHIAVGVAWHFSATWYRLHVSVYLPFLLISIGLFPRENPVLSGGAPSAEADLVLGADTVRAMPSAGTGREPIRGGVCGPKATAVSRTHQEIATVSNPSNAPAHLPGGETDHE